MTAEEQEESVGNHGASIHEGGTEDWERNGKGLEVKIKVYDLECLSTSSYEYIIICIFEYCNSS